MCLFLSIVASPSESSGGFWSGPIIRNHPVTAVGRVRCLVGGVYKPLSHVKIELLDEDGLFDSVMGSTITNSSGYFWVSGEGRDGLNGKPDPKIRIEYTYSGTYGKMDVEHDNIFAVNRKEETGVRSNRFSSFINFGNLDYNNEHCRAYFRFYEALKEYYNLTGEIPAYGGKLHVRTGAKDEPPLANTDVIYVPHSWDPISKARADQLFAYTVRNSFDGSFLHFLSDSRKYDYSQRHSCNTKTNSGFAFLEGWAAYYAGLCFESKGTDYTVEGNVATALRRLVEKCRSSKGRMISVLKLAGPESIYSFQEFNTKHQELFNCTLA